MLLGIVRVAPCAGNVNPKSCDIISYPRGQDGAILPARDYPLCPQENSVILPYNISFIVQACPIKMAGC